MLTFDNVNLVNPEDDGFRNMLERKPPEIIEVGESDEFWVYARRSTKSIEFKSKADGKVTRISAAIFDSAVRALAVQWP